MGEVEAERPPRREIGDQGEAEARERRDRADGRRLAGQGLPLARPETKENRDDDRERKRPADPPGAGREFRARHVEAANVEKQRACDDNRLARAGERLQDRIVPEEQLQQQRRIAHDLDIDQRDFGDEPVRRKARDADRKAERRREHDARRADERGVEKPNPERLAIGRQRGIGDERLVDVEAGGLVPEAEARRNAARRHIDIGVVGGGADERGEDKDEQRLIGVAPDPRVIKEGRR